MEGRKFGLSDSQLGAVIFCSIVGSGIATLPRGVGDIAGRDGWLGILLAGVLVNIFGWFIYLLCRRFPNRTLPEFSALILGRPLGYTVSCLYGLYAIVLAASSMRTFAELGKNWLMIWTPMPVFLIALIIPVAYTTRLGLTTLGRLMELVVLLTIPALALFLIPVLAINPLNLRPVGAEGIVAIASAVPEAAYSFLGFELLLVFFPFVANKQRVLRVYLLTLTGITVLYAGNTLLIYSVLGIEDVLLQVWPLLNYLRIGALPVAERFDNVVLFLWTAQVFGVVVVHYFAGTFIFATVTKNRYHDLWALGALPLLYLVAILPYTLTGVFELTDIVGRLGTLLILAMVALLLVVAWLRGLDDRIKEAKGK